ncbi:MAG: hypothetical protein Q9M91_06765 [Candidatus Dojkabacteria bacterium]|nr:hypothetical protein [Candidatus Dojkabacteria bacterium]MDQ7021496.1 hypothetical protein [Candidatus Dojkabacteria bacterium]
MDEQFIKEIDFLIEEDKAALIETPNGKQILLVDWDYEDSAYGFYKNLPRLLSNLLDTENPPAIIAEYFPEEVARSLDSFDSVYKLLINLGIRHYKADGEESVLMKSEENEPYWKSLRARWEESNGLFIKLRRAAFTDLINEAKEADTDILVTDIANRFYYIIRQTLEEFGVNTLNIFTAFMLGLNLIVKDINPEISNVTSFLILPFALASVTQFGLSLFKIVNRKILNNEVGLIDKDKINICDFLSLRLEDMRRVDVAVKLLQYLESDDSKNLIVVPIPRAHRLRYEFYLKNGLLRELKYFLYRILNPDFIEDGRVYKSPLYTKTNLEA